MSYPADDISDMPTPCLYQLINEIGVEIGRRDIALEKGVCPYCSQPLDRHKCRWSHRIENFHTPSIKKE